MVQKVNKLTAGHNLMWEGSRYILPEHREALNERDENERKKGRVELDDQELQEINYVLHQSKISRQQAVFRMFDELEELEVVGVVERIDQHMKRFRVDGEWFELTDIVHGALQ